VQHRAASSLCADLCPERSSTNLKEARVVLIAPARSTATLRLATQLFLARARLMDPLLPLLAIKP
jgi:hypothetical protein